MFLGLFLGLGQVNQALGPVSNNRSANVVGVGGTGTSGSITFITASVVGVGGTASIGSITVTSSDRHANVTGVTATGSAGSVAASTDAVQTTAFLARTSGLSGTETAAYKALINGLVADGTFSLLDALYIFATNTTTTANLNLISTSFSPLAQTGGVTFTADVGYTGDGTTGFLDTGYNPSTAGAQLTLNSASFGTYIRSTVADVTSVAMGAFDGATGIAYMSPVNTGNVFQYDANADSFPSFSNTNPQGAWVVSRTGSTATSVYKNGSSSAVGTSADASTNLPTADFTVLALNNAGAVSSFTNYNLSAAFIGGGLTGAQAAAINNRINTFMASLSTPVNVY